MGNGNNYADNFKQEALSKYQKECKTKSIKVVAKELNVPQGTFYEWIKKANLTPTQQRNPSSFMPQSQKQTRKYTRRAKKPVRSLEPSGVTGIQNAKGLETLIPEKSSLQTKLDKVIKERDMLRKVLVTYLSEV